MDPSLKNLKDELLLDIIFYGSDKCKDTVNEEILLHIISFIKDTKRFERPILTTNCFLLLLLLYFFSRKFNLKHCLLPIISIHTSYSSI